MANAKIANVDSGNWDAEVSGAATPVLLDFWAEWCGPCRAIAPILDELADELDGQLKIAKVDVDKSQDLAAKFGVRSIPTLLVLKGGTVAEQMVGAMSKAALKSKLQAHLS